MKNGLGERKQEREEAEQECRGLWLEVQAKREWPRSEEKWAVLICFWWGVCMPCGQIGYKGWREEATMRIGGAKMEETGKQGRLVGEIKVVFGPQCI